MWSSPSYTTSPIASIVRLPVIPPTGTLAVAGRPEPIRGSIEFKNIPPEPSTRRQGSSHPQYREMLRRSDITRETIRQEEQTLQEGAVYEPWRATLRKERGSYTNEEMKAWARRNVAGFTGTTRTEAYNALKNWEQRTRTMTVTF